MRREKLLLEVGLSQRTISNEYNKHHAELEEQMKENVKKRRMVKRIKKQIVEEMKSDDNKIKCEEEEVNNSKEKRNIQETRRKKKKKTKREKPEQSEEDGQESKVNAKSEEKRDREIQQHKSKDKQEEAPLDANEDMDPLMKEYLQLLDDSDNQIKVLRKEIDRMEEKKVRGKSNTVSIDQNKPQTQENTRAIKRTRHVSLMRNNNVRDVLNSFASSNGLQEEKINLSKEKQTSGHEEKSTGQFPILKSLLSLFLSHTLKGSWLTIHLSSLQIL